MSKSEIRLWTTTFEKADKHSPQLRNSPDASEIEFSSGDLSNESTLVIARVVKSYISARPTKARANART